MKKILFKSLITLAAFGGSFATSAEELRLSHQWSNKDIRHQVAQMVADDVKAADVDLTIKIFGSKSLFKPREQYRPVSRGQLDMTLVPLSYAGGQQPAYNLTLMPGLVKNHDHAARLSNSSFMKEIEKKMAEDDVMVLVHGYLAGGFVGKDKCITKPADVKGLQMRAAGKSFEQMLAGAGASIASMASSEIYNAMQTGVLNGANTSSASFVSYRIYEQAKCYTPAADVALWFMYQPLLMNKTTFENLNSDQQAALLAASKKAQNFYLVEAKKQDAASADVFRKAGVEVVEMTPADFTEWRELAKGTSYKKFAEDVSGGQALLDLALAVE
ncbi:TRAP transporter substrate-binding protein DctP [Marinomonas transparens]|uniref:TRAP transporter substrate-binding protein DctP n=1 Tax=Marinomonas transparens TaxID=2795388 RepID=A0A934JP82_9GAMM|nr:TRAP transporter substrate-binding protein DctP [Marinomonas transparens]MBJ7538108.1 TRAP transporter substrate-binding protein DctP [Marinomonas transparens]